MLKTCPKCEDEKETELFANDSSTTDGLRVYCRDCESARMRLYNSRPEVKELTKKWWLWRKYKITPEQKEELFEVQGHSCAICKTTDPGTKGWVVDHDHGCCQGTECCGKCIRGILCSRCNLGLGHFSLPETLLAAYNYLRKDPFSWNK